MPSANFLAGEVDEETLRRYRGIVGGVRKYPFIIQILWDKYFKAVRTRDWTGATKPFLDTFEMTAQFLVCVLLEQLRREDDLWPVLAPIAARLDAREMNMGDWVGALLKLAQAGAALDPPNALAVSFMAHYRQGKKLTRFGQRLLHVTSLRNKSAHTPRLDPGPARLMLEQDEFCLFELLVAVHPLADCAMFTRATELSHTHGQYEYEIEPQSPIDEWDLNITTKVPLSEDGFYMVRRDRLGDLLDGQDIVQLPPLVIFERPPLSLDEPREAELTEGRLPYLLQGRVVSNRQFLVYVTPSGRPARHTAEHEESFVAFLRALGLGVGSAEPVLPTPADLTWEEAQARAAAQTRSFVKEMRSKYDPRLYVPRVAMHEALDRFLERDQRQGFVLLGSSGCGKTNLLCREAEALLLEPDRTCALLFHAKTFAHQDLGERLRLTFQAEHLALKGLLKRLSALTQEQPGRQVVILFDAVNECVTSGYESTRGFSAPAQLIACIDDLLVKHRLPGLKIVLSCRTFTWEEARRAQGHDLDADLYFTSRDLVADAGEERDLELAGFTEAEFVQAWKLYRAHYDLQTSLDELAEQPRLRRQLMDPLRLRMVGEGYRGRAIPPGGADSALLMERRIEALCDGQDAAQRILVSTILLLFAELLWLRSSDALRLTEIRTARPPTQREGRPEEFTLVRERMVALRDCLFDERGELGRAFTLLLDRDVLRIDTGTAYPELRFVYERFHEYLLGQVLLGAAGQHEGQGRVSFFEEEIARSRTYAVAWGGVRNALVQRWRRKGDSELLRQLASGMAPGAQGMVVEVIVQMAQDDLAAALELLKLLLATPAVQHDAVERLVAAEEEIANLRGKLKRRGARRRSTHRDHLDAQEELRRELLATLSPLIRAKQAAIKALYDIYRSSLYQEGLVGREPPLELLWRALGDPLEVIRDAATRHVYYLWTEHRQTANEILDRLAEEYQQKGWVARYRKQARQAWLEPCGRLSGLVLVESLLHGDPDGDLPRLRAHWQGILRHLMLGGLAHPFVVPLVRRMLSNAGSTISQYVNNITEYQNFYEASGVPAQGEGYTRQTFLELVRFLDPDESGFEAFHDLVVAGAALGDALNNFLIERVLIAQGVHGYARIAEVVRRIYEVHEPGHPLRDYTQMSMLYVIFHTLDKMPSVPQEHFETYQRYMQDWIQRTKGLFHAHVNDLANEGKPYKQYTLNWYGALHARLHGDGQEPMPLFEGYLQQAFEEEDLALFTYVVDNIAMLAADFGYYRSSLRAFESALSLFRSEGDLRRFEDVDPDFNVRAYLARSLATIRGYFGPEVDRFVADEATSLRFPGADRFREELVRFEASESMGDLLTHKFGNLWVQGIVSIPPLRAEIQALLRMVPEQDDVQDWLTAVARRLLKVLFDL